MDRRSFLRGALAGTALAGTAAALGRSARAGSPGGADLGFVFVVNYGGWDPTRVFAPLFGQDGVDMESDAAPATAGNIPFVHHPDRPAVRSFFEAHHADCLVLNGLLVPSVAHPASLRRLLTGGTAGDLGDWPALIAAARADAFTLPHVVISGPSYPGVHGDVVCRTGTNGQLAALLAGDLYTRGDRVTGGPTATAATRIDRYVGARAALLLDAAVARRDQALFQSVVDGLARGDGLKAARDAVDWASAATFTEQAALAVDVLALGLARCVTLSYTLETWDSHVSNDLYQSTNFQGLFGELELLMAGLAATPGSLGGTLAEQTVVVVLSEMGRTPALNHSGGKDHWSYTSGLLVGPGLTTDRVIGGWDSAYYGEPLDLASGEITADGDDLGSEVVGATLLALADIDPAEARPGVTVLSGALET
jgi:uncharacterized protein (DUF1501 family)